MSEVQQELVHLFDGLRAVSLSTRRSEKWRRYPPDILPAFIAEMDFPVAEPVLDAIRAHLTVGGDLGYAYAYTTDAPVQRAFADWARASYDWRVEPREVVLFPDTMRVMEVALEQFTEPGDGVVVDVPAYPPYFEAIAAAGRQVVPQPMRLRGGRWRLDLEGLARAFRAGAAAYFLCNPHNPTGRVLTADELREVLALAAEFEVAVISDEVHAPLTHPGHRHVPLGALPEAARVATVTAASASKGWNLSGLKCAMAVAGRPRDHDRLMEMRPRERDGVGILGVSASEAAFTLGDPWLRTVRHYLHGSRRMLVELFESFGPDLELIPPEASYLAWLDGRRLADRLGSDDLADFFLGRGKVAVSDGREYGIEGFIRLNFGTSQHLLEEMVRRMEKAVREEAPDSGGAGEAPPRSVPGYPAPVSGSYQPVDTEEFSR
ncbi:aminotransferase class I/II-fold pyridoxal phosphate-dependent enzyme [Streptomyces sp. LP11]|uniref:cysteine-S-conjugate beta-lyase n=1 Tax=Streptomyces pyxinicus TaxID=2970331 RepID=A0ABT2BAE0_9ACTN|nr:aminotransferase class I/II-fold pyridoxal phosphate-dependent enzyme [Streptomyces sp. LP11]MCS0605417.1 aminotransferase class I/II-fold pyridoxal phosphate-dependent enzyme [Streptomyces sp. LP11]